MKSYTFKIGREVKARKVGLSELQGMFKYSMLLLDSLCMDFDNGRQEAALWIAVVLRNLLYTNPKQNPPTISILNQLQALESSYKVKFISSCLPKPKSGTAIQGWAFGSNIHDIDISSVSVFAGLLIKTLMSDENGSPNASLLPMKGQIPSACHQLSLGAWLGEEIFYDYNSHFSLTRLKTINIIAAKEGGACPSKDLPLEYDTFNSAQLAKVYFNNKGIPFENNPIYVSLRQIAWEVLETFKENKLFTIEENTKEKEELVPDCNDNDNKKDDKVIDSNDFYQRMIALEARNISVPLTGEGAEFLCGVITYALEKAEKYICFYLPLNYQDVIVELREKIVNSQLSIKGLFYGITQEQSVSEILSNVENIKLVEPSKFPFVIYDDKYYAIEDIDKEGNKIWMANMDSESVVDVLKQYFDKKYDA